MDGVEIGGIGVVTVTVAVDEKRPRRNRIRDAPQAC